MLLIAIGNPLRRDDGAAHAVAGQVASRDSLSVHQLTPEVAVELTSHDTVVFVDADAMAREVSLELLGSRLAIPPAVTHVTRPAEVVHLARRLFGFSGNAFLCRIPATDFTPGEGLSRGTAAHVSEAVRQIAALNSGTCTLA